MICVVFPAMALDYAELSPFFLWKKTVESVGDIAGKCSRQSDEAILVEGVFELLAVVDLRLELRAEVGGGCHVRFVSYF